MGTNAVLIRDIIKIIFMVLVRVLVFAGIAVGTIFVAVVLAIIGVGMIFYGGMAVGFFAELAENSFFVALLSFLIFCAFFILILWSAIKKDGPAV